MALLQMKKDYLSDELNASAREGYIPIQRGETLLSRVERFRQTRRLRIKCFFVSCLCLVLIATGVCVADYSFNNLSKNQKTIDIVSLKSYDSYIEISCMNKNIYINTSYIKKDYKRLKNIVQNIIGIGDGTQRR